MLCLFSHPLCLPPSLVCPVFQWIGIKLMKGSLKWLMSVGLQCCEPEFCGCLIVESLVCEIKKEDECHFKLSLCSSQQTHLSLFLCLPPLGLQSQIYCHPRSCVTAVYLPSSANGYLLCRLPRWLSGWSTEQGALTLSHLGVRTQFPRRTQRGNKTDNIQGF